jgi:hypothetical protein
MISLASYPGADSSYSSYGVVSRCAHALVHSHASIQREDVAEASASVRDFATEIENLATYDGLADVGFVVHDSGENLDECLPEPAPKRRFGRLWRYVHIPLFMLLLHGTDHERSR